MAKKIEISDELKTALKTVVEQFDKEEMSVRERQIRLWKKLEYYWSGFTRIWWSEVNHDWRIYDSSDSEQSDYYDKQINVFRAYLESIIAALSSTVPPVRCKPDDANNVSDVTTARGGTKIAELVYDHINAELLWCKALFVYCTQGMIAAYNYTVESEKFGTVNVAQYEDVEEDVQTSYCPLCQMEFTPEVLSESVGIRLTEQDEYDPRNTLEGDLSNQGVICPNCQSMVNPEIRSDKVLVNRLVGTTTKPKARQMIEVYGGLYVKIPNWARRQSDIPALGYCYETHYTNVLAKYGDELRKQMDGDDLDTRVLSTGGNEAYERWGRLSPQYWGEYPMETPTVRNWWLRPVAFEAIVDDDLREEAKKKFPDGCKIVFVNDLYAECIPEALDDHWTITRNPLSEYVHFDPLGLLLTSVQDITTDLVSLTLQTIEHGIPQTFADPSVLDFDAYRQMEASPGSVIPAKPKGGKGLNDAFAQLKTATLSQEVLPFTEKINEMGQFVSGAMPSIWGGSEAGGSSRTAAQAQMSRNQSLQRLQTPWKMINVWWKEIFGKVIPAYMKNMLEDERIVKEVHNSFINETIKKSQLDGKLGSVSLESSDDLPQTWQQIKDTIMQLMATNNEGILQSIASVDNMPVLRRAIGLNDFIIPGEKDREKQFEEIQTLIQTEPISDGMQEMPSVMPEQDVDNHALEAEVCRSWLVGETGRIAKIENQAGYRNVLLHMQMHQMMGMMGMAGAPSMPQEEAPAQEDQLRPIE